MTEHFLHQLWNNSVLPVHQMKLTDDGNFLIINKGTYNQFQSGPDFSNAIVKIDGIEWCGAIEFHLKSSDWMRHNHQYDRAYDQVILHIVWFDDVPVIQNGRVLPTLELRRYVSMSMYTSYLSLLSNRSTILCSDYLFQVPEVYKQQMIANAGVDRLQRKVEELDEKYHLEPSQLLYSLLARSFGSKVNAQPFEELSIRIPLSLLRKMKREKVELLLISESGLASNSRQIQTEAKMEKFQWKFKGLRPAAFPTIRVAQFARLVALINWDELVALKTQDEIFDFTGRLFLQFNHENEKLKLSKGFQNLLLINSIIPFFIWKNRRLSTDFAMENAIEFLSLLPAEANHITLEWKKRGVTISDAFESQGAIELYQQKCLNKKCLSCSVGQKLMRE